jgi:dTDP-4-amino-4,6-dideoxygalactose transaminase
MAVCLFGQPADYPALADIARRHGLKLIADSAQGFGCTLDGHHPIHWADVATTSFFPAKPLGAYGDGGAVLSKDARLHDLLVSLRVHGQAVKSDIEGRTFEHDPKYLNMRVGMNSRMDTLQAAILLQKLTIFADEIEARNRVADRYAEGLKGVVETPVVIPGGRSVWAQYTVFVPEREAVQASLKAEGIPTAVHYPIPMNHQPAYQHLCCPDCTPNSLAAGQRVMSLPMSAELMPESQQHIVAALVA